MRELIERKFEHGDRFYTEREIIEQTGFSQPTVRRALSDLAVEGLLTRTPKVGTFVQKQSERWLGVFLPGFDSPVLTSALQTLALVARRRGFKIAAYHTHQGETSEEVVGLLQRGPQAERMLLIGHSLEGTEWLRSELEKRGYKTLALEEHDPGFAGASLCGNSPLGVRLLVDHLLAFGHRRITLLVNEPVAMSVIRLRIEAFQEIVRERGLTECRIVDCETPAWGDSVAAARKKMDSILADADRPTAIVAVSGEGGLAVVKHLNERGVAVPEEMSVCGYDSVPGCEWVHPSLTTTQHPERASAELAIDRLWGKAKPSGRVLIDPTLVVRDSTGPASRRD